jgi:chromosome segregation ATPase
VLEDREKEVEKNRKFLEIENISDLTAELENERLHVTELETKINEWTNWSVTVTRELEDRNHEIELLEEYKRNAIEEIGLLEERIHTTEEVVCGNLRAQIESAEASKIELEKRIDEWSVWANEVTSQLSERDREITDLVRTVDEHRSRVTELEEVLKSESAELESTRELVSELTSQVNDLIEERARAERDELLAEENKRTVAQLAVRDATIAALLSRKPDTDDLDRIKKLLSEKEIVCDQLGAMIADQKNLARSKLEIEGENGQLHQQLERMKISNINYETRVNELENQLGEYLETIFRNEKESTEELVSLNRAIDELRSRNGELEALTRDLQHKRTDANIHSTELETQMSEAENRLVEWSKWADEITSQLAERDATIAELSMNQEHFSKSLAEAETLRLRVCELEECAKERIKNLSDNSPLGRRFEEGATKGGFRDMSPIRVGTSELESAREVIERLKIEINELKSANVNDSPKRSQGVTSEEAGVLLEAYRVEIDRLAKENAQLRTTAGNHRRTDKATWWNILEGGSSPRTAPAAASDSPNSNRL